MVQFLQLYHQIRESSGIVLIATCDSFQSAAADSPISEVRQSKARHMSGNVLRRNDAENESKLIQGNHYWTAVLARLE